MDVAHESGPTVRQIDVSAYTVPTDGHESDGTIEWDSTTLILAEASSDSFRGIGYTYASPAAALLIRDVLAPLVTGRSTFDIPSCWTAMVHAVRNIGRPGIASMAISAVDAALWDLKAKILGLPLVSLLGSVRNAVEVYGSGGFTSYSIDRLQRQLADWAQSGIRKVKMKVGRAPRDDVQRVRAAREAVGPGTSLFVDANGAYTRKQALAQAEEFAAHGVCWFEEPVSSDDLEGLRLMRDRAPALMDIAAGEYGHDLVYFRRMLSAGAVDVLQADATRCGGITGFMEAGALCSSFGLPLSAHTAPSLHAHPCCAISSVCHLEYFHDHTRIENMFFEGVLKPVHGQLHPELSRPGLGLEFKRNDAKKYEIRI